MSETPLVSSSPATAPSQPALVVSAKNKSIGLLFIVGPNILLITVLVVYAIMGLIFSNVPEGSSKETAGDIIQIALGFIGILSVLAFILGIPLAIIFFNKKTLVSDVYDVRSGKGKDSVIPEEIKGWSWGASGLGIIWGAYHSVWLSFIQFVPGISIVWWIVMGIMGNEWAWSSQPWRSVEEFKASQAKWNTWGFVFFVFGIFVTIAYICLLVILQPDITTTSGLLQKVV